MKKTRCHQARRESWADAISASQVFQPDEATRIVELVRIAHGRLLKGEADLETFVRVGCAINVASVRAEAISPELVEILSLAGAAMNDSQERADRVGRYGLTGPGILALQDGIDAYEAIVRASSPLQMQQAADEVTRRVNLLKVSA